MLAPSVLQQQTRFPPAKRCLSSAPLLHHCSFRAPIGLPGRHDDRKGTRQWAPHVHPVSAAGQAMPHLLDRAAEAQMLVSVGWNFEGDALRYLALRFFSEIVIVGVMGFVLVYLLSRVSAGVHKEEVLAADSFSSALQAWPQMMLGPSTAYLAVAFSLHALQAFALILDATLYHFTHGLPSWLAHVLQSVCMALLPLGHSLHKFIVSGLFLYIYVVFRRWKPLLERGFSADFLRTSDNRDEVQRNLILPVSTLVDWLVTAATLLLIVHQLGINLQPLVALGGASSIIIGLGTQQLLSNAVSGINIITSRLFVLGDVVSINGILGIVKSVHILRTVLTTEDGSVVEIPNKVITESVLYNRTRMSGDGVPPLMATPRQLRFRVKVTHDGLPKLQLIQEQLLAVLSAQLPLEGKGPGRLTMSITKFTDTGAEISARCKLVASYVEVPGAAPWQSPVQEAMIAASATLRQNGATLLVG